MFGGAREGIAAEVVRGEYEARRGAMRPSSRGAVSSDAHVVGFGSRLTAPNHFVRPPFSADCQKGKIFSEHFFVNSNTK